MSKTADTSSPDPLDEIIAEYLTRLESHDPPQPAELIERNPEFAEQLRQFFADKMQIDDLAGTAGGCDQTPAIADASTFPPTLGADKPDSAAKNKRSLIGERVRYFGDYELLEEIARGGMGVVYKARQVSLNRVVALKMILAGQLASEADVRRFQSEAEAAANLDHPGIVPIFEIGQHEGQHYFSMSYVAGQSLADLLTKGPLPPAKCAELVARVAEAVEFANEHGVIHRDLKPGNILLDRSGNPRITDFGLAKKIEADSSLTHTGQILGTPSFMAPEQIKGDATSIGPAVDVYALGSVLYCTLTGRPPFQAATAMETMMQVVNDQPVPPKKLNVNVPKDLETICLKCLETDQRRRYQNCGQVAKEIQRYQAGKPILAKPVSTRERTIKWASRNPGTAAAVAITGLSFLIGLIGSMIFNLKLQNEKQEKTILSDQLSDRLGESLVQQSRSERLNGNRSRSFELIREAHNMRSVEELRREALETFAVPEVTLRQSITVGQVNWLGLDAERNLVAAHCFQDTPEEGDGTWIKIWDIESGRLMGDEEIIKGATHRQVGGSLEPFNWEGRSINFGEYNSQNFVKHSYDGIPAELFFVTESHRAEVAALWNPRDPSRPSGDGWLEIWDLQTRRPLQRLTGILKPWAAFSPDDSMLAVQGVIGARMTVRVWELSSQRIIGELIDNHWPKWDESGHHLVTVGPSADPSVANKSHGTGMRIDADALVPRFDAAINIWKVNNPVPGYRMILPVETILFGPNQQIVVSQSVFDLKQVGEQFRLIPQNLLDHHLRTTFFRDGTAWRFHAEKRWEVIDQKSVHVDLPNEFVAIDDPNSRKAIPDPPPDSNSQAEPESVFVPNIESIRVCQDADTIVLVGRERWMKREAFEEGPWGSTSHEYANPKAGAWYLDLWNISKLERRKTLWLTQTEPLPLVAAATGHAAILENRTIIDLDTGLTRLIPPEFEEISCAWINTDKIMLGTVQGDTYVLEPSTLNLLSVLKGTGHRVTALDSIGQVTIAGDEQGLISWYWDHHLLVSWRAHQNTVSSIGLSPDGSFFLSGCQDGTIRIWPIDAMREQLTDLRIMTRD